MSGGISFNSEKSWIVASWAYRFTVEHIRDYISKQSFPRLYSLLTNEENPAEFIFLEELNSDERKEFLSALKLAFNDIIKEDGETFISKEYYENYLILLKELMKMIPEND